MADDSGSARTVAQPEQVPELSGVVGLAAGGGFNCARQEDGTVRCWGAGGAGQLGDGAMRSSLTSVQVQGIDDAVQLVASVGQACVRTSRDEVWCWGDESHRVGTPAPQSLPRELAAARGAQMLYAGERTICSRHASGDVQCWGRNRDGMLAPQEQSNDLLREPVIVPALAGSTAVAPGNRVVCGLDSAGQALCHGLNNRGQLGRGELLTDQRRPVEGLSGLGAIVVGDRHVCARHQDGRVWCWGDNEDGQLGTRPLRNSTEPAQVPGITAAVEVVAGRHHFCARLADGTVQCWGYNQNGELGRGSQRSDHVPAPVTGLDDARSLAAGDSNTCALRAGGEVSCWGSNNVRQLVADRERSELRRSTPLPDLGRPSGITVGNSFVCAYDAVGGVTCTGGELERPFLSTSYRLISYELGGPPRQISAYATFLCAALENGEARCWGQNASGQLGLGDEQFRDQPTRVPGLEDVIEVATGARNHVTQGHACALSSGGTVACWGDNEFGQLGDATTQDRASPAPVVGLSDAAAIEAGFGHTCAIRADQTVVCWGRNLFGQLGDGSTESAITPVLTSTVRARQIALSDGSTCALGLDGTLACWGRNVDGQLGRDPLSLSDRPLQVTLASD